MSTHNNNDHLIIFNYLEKYLDKIIKEGKNKSAYTILDKVREESIIEILDELEGKWRGK